MPRQSLNPDNLFDSIPFGFSQITIGQGSKIVALSGQVAWDENQNIIGDDLPKQMLASLENVKKAMIAAGGSLDDILSLRIYIKETELDDTSGVRDGLLKYFPESPPTSTWLGVPALARPEFLVEIEAMAVLA